MSNNQEWIEELSDFFFKDDNWKTACKTVDAVNEVKNYWKKEFWCNVKGLIENKLENNLGKWACEVDRVDEEVRLYPKDERGNEKRTCWIGVCCDEDDGGYFYIEVDRDKHKLGKKSSNYKGIRSIEGVNQFEFDDDCLFYLSNVVPKLDKSLENKAQLIDLVTGSKESGKLASKVASFANDTNIHTVLLSLKSDA